MRHSCIQPLDADDDFAPVPPYEASASCRRLAAAALRSARPWRRLAISGATGALSTGTGTIGASTGFRGGAWTGFDAPTGLCVLWGGATTDFDAPAGFSRGVWTGFDAAS